jgi:ATP-dependent Zn protease
MIIHYGMGNKYGGIGENSKNLINDEIEKILNDAYKNAYNILNNKKDCIISGSLLLKKQKSLTRSELQSHLMI